MFYNLINRRDPIGGTTKVYATAKTLGTVSIYKLARNVAARSGHSQGQVEGLLTDYMRRIEDYVMVGKDVNIYPLGCIIATLKSKGAATAEEFDASDISKVNLHLRPSSDMRRNFEVDRADVKFKLWKNNVPAPVI